MPQWVPVPFFGPAFQNLDESGVVNFATLVKNIYVDEANHTQKRPGLLAWADLGTNAPIDGLFWWDNERLLIAVSDKRVFKIDNVGGAATEISGTATLLKNSPVTFTFDTVRMYIANGGKIVHFTPTGSLTDMADTDAPTSVSHVAFIDQYILANIRGTAQWQFSEVINGLGWRAVDLFTAESSPDNLLALHTDAGEIILLGGETTEYWTNDGTGPFSSTRGTTTSEGAASPHTFAVLDRRRHWLTEKRRFVEIPLEKRQPAEVSLAINRELDALSDVSDARGFRCSIEGLSLYCLTFPNANRTFIYNYASKHWSEWNDWNTVRGVGDRWRGNNYAYAKPWNLHLVGDHSNGIIYTASRAHKNDNGKSIRLQRRTGFIDHQTSNSKRCYALKFKFKRAQGNGNVTNPTFLLRWRNDDGAWSATREGSLGNSGDHFFYVTFYNLGSYRSRQWELIYTDDAGFDLNGATELVAGDGLPGSNVEAGRGTQA